MRIVTRWLPLLALGAALSPPASAQELVKGLKAPHIFTLTSPAFSDRGTLPVKYSCDGEGFRPPLAWTNLPPGTKYLMITVDDAGSRKAFWSQWVAYNIPADVGSLAEGTQLPAGGPLPDGTRVGKSDWNKPGYDPPCPKPEKGKREFLITAYALNQALPDLGPEALRSTMLNASDQKVLGWARLFFYLDRSDRK